MKPIKDSEQIPIVKSPIKNPLIIALDVDSEKEALRLAEDLSPWAGAFKLGPRLSYRYGASLVQRISKLAPVFVDNKYFDIPSTMEAAVQASFEAGASLVTVHALSGREALSQLARLEKNLQQERPFVILCVTILTSWSEESFPSVFATQDTRKNVQELSGLVQKSGLSGLVCSAQELDLISAKNFFTVTPGIRFDDESKQDQKRVVGPLQAIEKGARGLVVGRPIIQAKDPQKVAQQYLQTIQSTDAIQKN